jgi:hypothetical protein
VAKEGGAKTKVCFTSLQVHVLSVLPDYIQCMISEMGTLPCPWRSGHLFAFITFALLFSTSFAGLFL